ncbi:hypothetical protein [Nocardioides plantarum]|uniref:DUF3558 domain-containing protein n=1 Tax=Nocardioides plantarum TaxID=29299 RepID=A0ABV5K3Z8_9ACTN|nr:hypothetical protein [Nocardioides plantarum]
MNSQWEDQLRSSIKTAGARASSSTNPNLTGEVKAIARRRWRSTALAAAGCVAVASVGIAALARPSDAPSPSNTAAASGTTDTTGAKAIACGETLDAVEIATTRDLEAASDGLTICRWSNPATGDPYQDKDTLSGQKPLNAEQSADLLKALQSARKIQSPSMCYFADSPPPLTYEVLIPTTAGPRAIPVSKLSCSTFTLADGAQFSSTNTLKRLHALSN